ncbi:hypothetical protein PMI13_03227, partial [Chryseobacterium populi]
MFLLRGCLKSETVFFLCSKRKE